MDSIKTASIAAIIRGIKEQVNLSKPDKDRRDCLKNVSEFHKEPPVAGKVFTTWYARDRDVYENRMAGLSQEMGLTILFRKFNKSGHDFYLAYHLPLYFWGDDPKILV